MACKAKRTEKELAPAPTATMRSDTQAKPSMAVPPPDVDPRALLADTVAARVVTAASPSTVPCAAQPPTAPTPTISRDLPVDVCIPAGFGSNPIEFFDDFSWRSFIAMVWPAQAGQRGVPDPAGMLGTPGVPLTFETLKADWEVFQPNGRKPSDWDQYTGMNPCGVVRPQFGDLVLASFSKFGNLGQADFGNLVGPLVAQNNTYARYLAAFNEVEYVTIIDKNLYLRAEMEKQQKLGDLVFAPDARGNNPIDVKSSWVDMTGIPHPDRYYKRKAWVQDPETKACAEITVGLVGLHIVTKTPSRPQWVWTTFEHVDNVPGPDAQAPFTFNDGTAVPLPDKNPIPFPPPPHPQTKVNVTRSKKFPINDSTAETNRKYRVEMAKQGSGVWQFYQLVMTQWPLAVNDSKKPGTPKNTFPGVGATSAYANVTMETFDQESIAKGCMACHTVVKSKTDFLWALQMNAFPAETGTSASQPQMSVLMTHPSSPDLIELRGILESK
jgi:hypothetical protein